MFSSCPPLLPRGSRLSKTPLNCHYHVLEATSPVRETERVSPAWLPAGCRCPSMNPGKAGGCSGAHGNTNRGTQTALPGQLSDNLPVTSGACERSAFKPLRHNSSSELPYFVFFHHTEQLTLLENQCLVSHSCFKASVIFSSSFTQMCRGTEAMTEPPRVPRPSSHKLQVLGLAYI